MLRKIGVYWVAYDTNNKVLGKHKLKQKALKFLFDHKANLFKERKTRQSEDKSPVVKFAKYFIKLEADGKI